MTIGGDILGFRFSNTDIGNGSIDPVANQNNTINLGGFVTDDDDKSITSNGKAIYKITNTRWNASVTVADDNITGTFETLQALKSSLNETDWTIAHVNQKVYTATGRIVGDIEKDMNAGTLTIKIAGGGDVTVQS